MSGLGIAFPAEAAAPIAKAVISSAPHLARPLMLAGLGIAVLVLCRWQALPLGQGLRRGAERSLALLRQALLR